jgi:hypothetical protein
MLSFSERKAGGDNLAVTMTKRSLLKRANRADFAIPFRHDYEMPASGVVTVPTEGGINFQAKINGKGLSGAASSAGSMSPSIACAAICI